MTLFLKFGSCKMFFKLNRLHTKIYDAFCSNCKTNVVVVTLVSIKGNFRHICIGKIVKVCFLVFLLTYLPIVNEKYTRVIQNVKRLYKFFPLFDLLLTYALIMLQRNSVNLVLLSRIFFNILKQLIYLFIFQQKMFPIKIRPHSDINGPFCSIVSSTYFTEIFVKNVTDTYLLKSVLNMYCISDTV